MCWAWVRSQDIQILAHLVFDDREFVDEVDVLHESIQSIVPWNVAWKARP